MATQYLWQYSVYVYLACWSYSLVRCTDTAQTFSELFHSRGFIPGQNPRCYRAAALLPCLSRTRVARRSATWKDNIEPIILSTVDVDSKVMSRYISDVQMYSKCSRCFWHEGQTDFPIITSDNTSSVVSRKLLRHCRHGVGQIVSIQM